MPPAPVRNAPAPTESPHDLVLFVSCVHDKPVTRLALTHRAGKMLIGAERVEGRIDYHPDQVIGLTRAEVDAFGPTYERTIREGDLVRRTRADWEAARAAQKAAQAATLARLEAEKIEAAKAAGEAARAADNGSAPPAGGAES